MTAILPPVKPILLTAEPSHEQQELHKLPENDSMKLLRVGAQGAEKPAVLDDSGQIRDLSSVINDIDGAALSDMHWARDLDWNALPVLPADSRIGPCVGNVGKFLCIGLNYADHAKEAGLPIPEEPILFMKATSSIIGPNDDVIIPRNSSKTDWEVELGVVIGKQAAYVSEQNALDHVAGYCLINDVSERKFQLEKGGQWVKGKSNDTFGPVGPWLVTSDDMPDASNLGMWLEVDGKRYQDGSTSTMVFNVAQLISYVSNFMSLQPGDIISTGTPPGVGLGQKPPVYLRAGQSMRLGIEGLGEQLQHVRDYAG